eukprot:scaffold5726_cov119-Skeletonema_dohrnii-CCMP3373.AAC.12
MSDTTFTRASHIYLMHSSRHDSHSLTVPMVLRNSVRCGVRGYTVLCSLLPTKARPHFCRGWWCRMEMIGGGKGKEGRGDERKVGGGQTT